MADTRGSGSHIFRSTGAWTQAGPPAGLAWEAVNNGIPSANPANTLAWGGSADRVMALVINNDGATTTPYLFDGTTWTAKPFNDANCIFTTDARSLAWGGNNDFFSGGVTFAYTPNAGDTWVCPPLNSQHVDIRAIAPAPNLGRVWVGADQTGLGGQFVISSYPWTPGVSLGDPTGIGGNGMSTWQANSVAVGRAPRQPRIIVAAQDVIDACSDDGGANWSLLSNTQEGQSLTWLQNNGADIIYSYGILGTLQVAVNPGSAATCSDIHFVDISPPDSLRGLQTITGPHLMAVNPSNSQQVFIALFRSITYTVDGGMHWASLNFSPPGFSSSPAPSAIFVDENGVIYVGTQEAGAFICTDTVNFCNGSEGSGTWTAWGLNPGGNVNPVGGTSPKMITAIAESNPPSAGPRNFWMASTDGIYRQLSGETTWTLVASTPSGFGSPPYVYNEVVVDPTCRTRIYTGIGYFDNFSRSRGGIQISSDNGGNWTSLSAGFDLHNVPITELAIVPQEPQRVLASTYGRGVWEYDWHIGQPVPPGNANLPVCAP
jgi:hypothetical protein